MATDRFRPIPRREARERLGLDAGAPHLLFPSDPARPSKRFDLAEQVSGGARLLTLKDVDPRDVPLWVNAANAVVMPSEAEGFGLAVLEALACDVPVVAAPVGVHPLALDGIDGHAVRAVRPRTLARGARTAPRGRRSARGGRARAELYSARRMAERVATAWADLGLTSRP